jgi:hypothetical protein
MTPPPDYIALLQSLQHTAAPTAADHQHYRAYVAKRAMSRDKTASAACTMLLSSALLYNISFLWRLVHMEADHLAHLPKSQLVSSAIAGVCWVLAHVLMELAFTCWVSRATELYKRHRSSCIMVTRTGGRHTGHVQGGSVTVNAGAATLGVFKKSRCSPVVYRHRGSCIFHQHTWFRGMGRASIAREAG